MTTYNTGNPLGSTDPRDLSDNAENLDRAVNDITSATWTDRFGVKRTTLAGQTGYIGTGPNGEIEDYAVGQKLTTFSTIIRYNGEFYRPAAGAMLPYTTTATTPDLDANLVAVGDAVLRQQLASNTLGQGSDLIAHTGTSDTVTQALDKRTIYVGSVAELEALSLDAGANVYLTQEGRAGEFVVKAGTPPSDPQKGIYIVLANGNYAERVEKERLYVTWFGAVGDGSTDDTASINGAIALAGFYGTIIFPGGQKSFLITSELIQLEGQQWIFEGGQRASKLLKGYNGNVVRMATLGRLISPFIDGNGPTYSGTNIVIKSGTFSQYLENVRTVSSVGPGILFEKNAGGGSIINGIEGGTTDPENVGVIALTEDTTAVPRFWVNLWLAGGVIDITGGGNGLAVSNFYLRNILTGYGGATPTRSGLYKINNGRVANLAGTTNITAADALYNNVAFSSNLILDDCQGVKFTPTCTFTSITENPNSRFNSFYTQSANPYEVVWSAPDGSLGVIGDGSMLARFARNGHFVKMQFELTFGSTTTEPSGGSGGWRFSLPFPSAIFFDHRGLPCEVRKGSTTYAAFGSIAYDSSKISFELDGQTIRNGWPSAWNSGDSLFFNIEYEAK